MITACPCPCCTVERMAEAVREDEPTPHVLGTVAGFAADPDHVDPVIWPRLMRLANPSRRTDDEPGEPEPLL